ncbi:MAG: hypothetical protein K5771_02590 [Oscillospiraceae bacterium]|nr:hypothetical protein [Oscillospiraceae bacterium]
MNSDTEKCAPQALTHDERKHRLYLQQKELLDTFLAHGTITKAQYDKSLHDLTEKMGEE